MPERRCLHSSLNRFVRAAMCAHHRICTKILTPSLFCVCSAGKKRTELHHIDFEPFAASDRLIKTFVDLSRFPLHQLRGFVSLHFAPAAGRMLRARLTPHSRSRFVQCSPCPRGSVRIPCSGTQFFRMLAEAAGTQRSPPVPPPKDERFDVAKIEKLFNFNPHRK